MKTQISFHNLEKSTHAGLENKIHELGLRNIEKYLARFPSDTAELKVHAEKSRRRSYYRVSAQLCVPGGTLFSREEGVDLLAATHKALDDIERELLRHIARLRQDDAWHRKERREELRRLKTAVEEKPEAGAEAFGDLVRELLPQLQRFMQREVSALRARGDLNPGYPTPQDIADEVLARAWQGHAQRPAGLDVLPWLYRLGHEALDDEARKFRAEQSRFVPLDQRTPQARDYTLDELDAGVFEFWQPDEMLRIDDVVPVTEATPEEKFEEQQLRKYFHHAVSRMPNNWRRAVWLAQAEGMPLNEVARTMKVDEEVVKDWIAQGDHYLRALLREAGYRPADDAKLPAWFVPTPASATPELAEALDDITRPAR